MKAHECYHCKQWVAEGEAHDCWTTTEAALTKDLSEDLQDAYQRLRETAIEFGEQRIYASHSSIMYARKACYFFVRPKRAYLEVIIFLGRAIRAPQVKKVVASSRVKRAHIVHVKHRDEVEAPITDWLREAYAFEPLAKAVSRTAPRRKPTAKARKKAAPARPAPRRGTKKARRRS
jgi:hypothetical protein